MKFLSIVVFASVPLLAMAAPVQIQGRDADADAATFTSYGSYPPPAGGYGAYPAPAGGYKNYPAPAGGYKNYPPPPGGYGHYRRFADMIKRAFTG
jgi:hypothetical protein